MARPTPQYDAALAAVIELETYVTASDDDAAGVELRERFVADRAIAAGLLAIAEALRGVVYVANASAV